MKKTLLPFIFLFILSFSISLPAQKLPKEVKKVMKKLELELDLPKEAEGQMVEPVENPDMSYELAWQAKDKSYEIRYSFRIANPELEEMLEKNPQLNYSMFWATMMNVTQTKSPPIGEFPEEAVKLEFNADWGATGSGVAESSFGEGYEVVLGYTIYRKGVGMAFVFFLADSHETLINLMDQAYGDWFHAIKFTAKK